MEGCINPRTYTQSHTPTVVQGGVDWTPPPPWVFDTLQSFETILPSVESLWSSLHKMRYILLVVALLEVCDVTKHGHHLGSHLRKTLGGWKPPPYPLYVRGLIRTMFSVITVDFPYWLWQRLISKLQENKLALLACLLIHNGDKKNRKRRQYRRIIILLACNCPHCYQNQYKENSSLH